MSCKYCQVTEFYCKSENSSKIKYICDRSDNVNFQATEKSAWKLKALTPS